MKSRIVQLIVLVVVFVIGSVFFATCKSNSSNQNEYYVTE